MYLFQALKKIHTHYLIGQKNIGQNFRHPCTTKISSNAGISNPCFLSVTFFIRLAKTKGKETDLYNFFKVTILTK